jgi:hypothetical protein
MPGDVGIQVLGRFAISIDEIARSAWSPVVA